MILIKENKLRFYRFLSYMLKITKNESGLKSNAKYYKFYDTVNLAQRLTLIVEEDLNHISLDILPF